MVGHRCKDCAWVAAPRTVHSGTLARGGRQRAGGARAHRRNTPTNTRPPEATLSQAGWFSALPGRQVDPSGRTECVHANAPAARARRRVGRFHDLVRSVQSGPTMSPRGPERRRGWTGKADDRVARLGPLSVAAPVRAGTGLTIATRRSTS